jgi:hypothetical protein
MPSALFLRSQTSVAKPWLIISVIPSEATQVDWPHSRPGSSVPAVGRRAGTASGVRRQGGRVPGRPPEHFSLRAEFAGILVGDLVGEPHPRLLELARAVWAEAEDSVSLPAVLVAVVRIGPEVGDGAAVFRASRRPQPQPGGAASGLAGGPSGRRSGRPARSRSSTCSCRVTVRASGQYFTVAP